MSDHKISRTSDGHVLKQYRPNAGDLPSREWRALQLLQEYVPGLAPEPLAADLDADPPRITMSALPGKPLGGQPLSSPELRAITVALDELHTCVPSRVLAEIPVAFHVPEALESIRNRLAAQPRPNEDSVVALAYDEALQWLSGSDANRLLGDEPDRAVLGQADHNLTDFLLEGERVRLVDFEYAGRTERCAEMGELVEHISARCTPDPLWQQFLDGLDFSRAERRRLLTIRRLLASMWLHMLLPGQGADHRNPPGTLRMQAQRVLGLLNS